ncbi:arginine deiminase [Halorubrum aquaticum]|uniref:Arginine deiminase n=1 Tax=Halorubrum aquaticum TaxID=387340 RepID=A0A1I3C5E6_9EURY|nr:arginine deiminase family protein [Halorubrum aquaticum]SFH69757.1 arginine deiminase [Halorubrum aquaticum]
MPKPTVEAEYDTLRAVRVHEPGIEAAIGAMDPGPNHFARPFSVREAKREHRRMVEVLENAGVEVRHIHEDLADGDLLEEFLEAAIEVDEAGASPSSREELAGNLRDASAYERLQAVLLGPTVGRTGGSDDDSGDAGSLDTSVRVDRAITNLYFQRDCQLVGDRGPILPRLGTVTRRREQPLIEAAWRARGAEFAHRTSATETLEGGDFLPLGDFALVGVSALEEGEETVFRTTYDGGLELLEAGAVGYDEVGLVRPPLAADERLAAEHGTSSRLLHLDGWLNVAAEGLAVAREPLIEAATVEVFERAGEGYERRGEETVAGLLDRHGYETIDAPYPERWATNFLTVSDGVVLPIYETDDGTYDPEENRTIERLKAEGVEVLPDGEGLDPDQLTNGGGGIHCMTSPIRRA